MKIFVWIILALTCLPFLGIGLYETFENVSELRGFGRAAGTVVGNTYSQTNIDGNLAGAYQPVVEFIAPGGEKIRFTDGVGSLPADYEIGAPVEVLFNPEKPQDARLYSWKRFWLVPSILSAVGFLPIAVAFILMRYLNI